MISDRYAPLLASVVALALVPVVLHSYMGSTIDDGRKTESIAPKLGEYASAKTDRDANWGQRRFESFDWFERRYISASDSVVLVVLRSYDLKKLYHHPELDVAYGVPLLRNKVARTPATGEIPVHMLYNDEESGGAALYVLQYGDDYVEDPLRFQVRSSLELLFSPRKAMTLFFVVDREVPRAVVGKPEQLPAASLLAAAIAGFNVPRPATR